MLNALNDNMIFVFVLGYEEVFAAVANQVRNIIPLCGFIG
jgi:hypothetical protein